MKYGLLIKIYLLTITIQAIFPHPHVSSNLKLFRTDCYQNFLRALTHVNECVSQIFGQDKCGFAQFTVKIWVETEADNKGISGLRQFSQVESKCCIFRVMDCSLTEEDVDVEQPIFTANQFRTALKFRKLLNVPVCVCHSVIYHSSNAE